MHPLDNNELFDHIYHNRADEPTSEAFKQRLQKDEQFRDDFREYLLINETGLKVAREQFKERFGARPMGGAVVRPMWQRPLAVAATVLMIVVAGLGGYNYMTYQQRLGAKYPLILDEDNLLGSEDLKGQLDPDEKDIFVKSEAALLQGLNQLENKEYEAAITSLDKVNIISGQEYDYYFIAQYNIALAYLELGDQQKAIGILTSITERAENHYLIERSENLLKDLARPKFLPF